MAKSKEYCNDYGDQPGCLRTPDPKFTMGFTSVEPGAYIYWCAHCGPGAVAMSEAFDRGIEELGVDVMSAAVDEAIANTKAHQH